MRYILYNMKAQLFFSVVFLTNAKNLLAVQQFFGVSSEPEEPLNVVFLNDLHFDPDDSSHSKIQNSFAQDHSGKKHHFKNGLDIKDLSKEASDYLASRVDEIVAILKDDSKDFSQLTHPNVSDEVLTQLVNLDQQKLMSNLCKFYIDICHNDLGIYGNDAP
jgi:hypothetical protein